MFHIENIGIDRRIFGILQTEIWYSSLYSITYCFYLITVNHWKKQHEIRYHTLELIIATSLNNAWFHKIIIHSYFSGITRRYSAKSSYIFLSLFLVINTLVLSKKSFWVDFDMSIMHCNAKILKFFKKGLLFRKFEGGAGVYSSVFSFTWDNPHTYKWNFEKNSGGGIVGNFTSQSSK